MGLALLNTKVNLGDKPSVEPTEAIL